MTQSRDELAIAANVNPDLDDVIVPPSDFLVRLNADVEAAGGELTPDLDREGAVGSTMFDLPSSEDNALIVLLPRETMQEAPSQSLVRIRSIDGLNYLGIVTAGPFAEPDSLRGDSHMLVTVATRGGIFLPPYHGRVEIAILGEELEDGSLTPPRLRPLPNSPVFCLDDDESAAVLKTDGDLRLGLVVGYEHVVVGVPSDQKAVLPRHTAVLGTTGSGKSTTISRLVQQAQRAAMAVILLDVEGEYTFMHEPTEDSRMLSGLSERGLAVTALNPARTRLYHLIGRDTANPDHPNLRPFSLQFARLSPYAVSEILEFTEPQEQRFFAAYEIAKSVMRDLNIFPRNRNSVEEREAVEIDEFERGYPRLTLPLILDIVAACHASVAKAEFTLYSEHLRSDEARRRVVQRVNEAKTPGNVASWRALLGKLGMLNRIKVFDRDGVKPIHYKDLLFPGVVSIIDLSDSGASQLNNIVIADLLKGLQDAQDDAFEAYEMAKDAGQSAVPLPRVLLIIEEAHEFLSSERIGKMPILFQQLARIAKRGRKRWLGLVFVTQLPQHLPAQVLGLVNSFVLHKISDPGVISTLRKTVSGIDDGLWLRLPGLAPGQAIVSFPHMTRPLLVSIDPTPAKLRLVD